MRLIVLDPNLDHTHGHHALYGRLIAHEAARRECETLIIGNRALGLDMLDGIPVLPLLTTTCYGQHSQDPLFADYDNVERGNAAVFGELCDLPADLFRPSDLVVVHTVNQTTLNGLVSWIATLPVATAPQFCIFLMLPSGIGFDKDGTVELLEPASALGYRAAFERAKALPHDILFFGSGPQHAEEFSALSGIDIESHAILSSFDETPLSGEIEEDKVLLFAGDAKMNKGLGHLPGLVEAVCPAHPDLRFVIHANPGAAWGEALEIVDTLREMAPNYPNLDLRLSALSSEDYVSLLASSAISTLCYDPVEYRRKSSGVVWEAIASKSQLVVPKDTWLERECLHWGAAHVAYAKSTPSELARALKRVIQDYTKNRDTAAAAAERFAAANGIKAMLDQLADFWMGRSDGFMTQSGQSLSVSAPDFGNTGWYGVEQVGDTQVRWGSSTCELDVALPGIGTWQMTLEGPFCFSPEQLQNATATVDGISCPTAYEMDDSGTWSLSFAFEETDVSMPGRKVVVKPGWVQSSDEDPRELGLLATTLTIAETSAEAVLGSGAFEPASAAATVVADGWTAELAHGRWAADVGTSASDCVLAFKVEGAASPETLAGMKVLLNGRQIAPRVLRGGDWQAQLLLSGAAAAGGRLELDIILPAPARIAMQDLVWSQDKDVATPAPVPAVDLAEVLAAEPEAATQEPVQEPEDSTEQGTAAEAGDTVPASGDRQLFIYFPPHKMVRDGSSGEIWLEEKLEMAAREQMKVVVCSPNLELPEHASQKLQAFAYCQYVDYGDIDMPTVFELPETADDLNPRASYKVQFRA